MRVRSIVVFMFLCLVLCLLHAENLQISLANSSWTNAAGSILNIETVDEVNGKLSGYYINKEESFPCRNIPYPLTGFIYEDCITFSVIWKSDTESCDALTTWIGKIEGNEISTSWQLVNHEMTDITNLMSGKDNFRKN
ncbi:MAG: avidin/streptavidin family protein [Candidatus Cloacimonetes bacterium]|nr:avidin/streptavidin family protein [Candidatus Cloacimonadota bacterium]MCF7814472.1 avidin/streptavidin family protein [Candidatus Cloacimonadota bacterium]MCF7869047.1 avidin/streptavidin family protein [Candidatus Cloacimonadota bacterium]MCF7884442.1 avidin/streptavidin family protein [Candidatus Cloacimonadota bacterium]